MNQFIYTKGQIISEETIPSHTFLVAIQSDWSAHMKGLCNGHRRFVVIADPVVNLVVATGEVVVAIDAMVVEIVVAVDIADDELLGEDGPVQLWSPSFTE